MMASSNAFGVVLVFLDKDVYEIHTPDNPLTIFIESPYPVWQLWKMQNMNLKF